MPKPMQRSRSMRRLDRVTPTGRHVVHYTRRKNSMPHCSICEKELSGISIKKNAKGKSLKTNSRIFGGVLCGTCASEVVKYASRIEHGEMKMSDVSVKQRAYILQMVSH